MTSTDSPGWRDAHHLSHNTDGYSVLSVGLMCSCHYHRRYLRDPRERERIEAQRQRVNGG